MKTTKVLLLTALSMCWGFQAAEAQTGTVEGVVSLDGTHGPLEVGAYAYPYRYYGFADATGHYEIQSVPTGVPVNIYLYIGGVSYHVVSPADGDTTVTLSTGDTARVDFVVEAIQGGPVRGLGWWRHQFNSLVSGHGNTEYSWSDMGHFAGHMYWWDTYCPFPRDSFMGCYEFWWAWTYNGVWGWDGLNGRDPTMDGYWGQKWCPHFWAVLANIFSCRLHTYDVVSTDGATVWQAILEMVYLSGAEGSPPPWGEGGPTPADAQVMKDIAEAMNEGRMIPAGVIDLTRPTVYWTHAMPSAPVVDQVRVTPNPMVRTSTLDFEVAAPGQVEVRVFEIAGRAVRTVLDGELSSGRQTVVWDGKDDGGSAVANGVYFYRIETPGGEPFTARFVVMR